jgi:L-ornithine N5-monooxygenase
VTARHVDADVRTLKLDRRGARENVPWIYDLVGIGFGPSNIALAIALEETGQYPNHLFLEQAETPLWQSEMLFDISLDTFSNIQNIPYRDLVTPRNPRSRYTFLNYLFESDLLFDHLNMDMLLPLRPDYARYISWVAEQFTNVLRTGQSVDSITYERAAGDRGAYRITTRAGDVFLTRHVVVGTGRIPYIPPVFAEHSSPRIFHQTRYKTASDVLSTERADKVAVVGSSQSAAEIILHLSKTLPNTEIHSVMRRFAFPLRDTSPFMNEIFFPRFTDLYYDATTTLRRRIDRDVIRTNYGACDMDILEELYRQIYYDRLHGREQIRLHRLTDIVAVGCGDDQVTLTLADNVEGRTVVESFDAVILATGFANIGSEEREVKTIGLLDGLAPVLEVAEDGCIQVDRGYAVRLRADVADGAGAVIMNGLCETTHGMGDGGSLSLVSIRAADILRRLYEWDESAPGYPSATSSMRQVVETRR